MMAKKYVISYPTEFWECTVEIQPDFVIKRLSKPNEIYTTLHAMEDMVKFWHGGESRLNDNDGDVIKTFLQQLGREIYIIVSSQDLNYVGVMDQLKKMEGWYAVDHQYGITITDVDVLVFDHKDFEVEEIENA